MPNAANLDMAVIIAVIKQNVRIAPVATQLLARTAPSGYWRRKFSELRRSRTFPLSKPAGLSLLRARVGPLRGAALQLLWWPPGMIHHIPLLAPFMSKPTFLGLMDRSLHAPFLLCLLLPFKLRSLLCLRDPPQVALACLLLHRRMEAAILHLQSNQKDQKMLLGRTIRDPHQLEDRPVRARQIKTRTKGKL